MFSCKVGVGVEIWLAPPREANLGLTPGLPQCQFHVSVSWETEGREAGTVPGKNEQLKYLLADMHYSK